MKRILLFTLLIAGVAFAKAKTKAAAPVAPVTPEVQDANALLERANALYLQGKYAPSVLLYRKAAQRGADPVACAFNSANAWFRIDKLAEAAAAYRKAVDFSQGTFAPALFNLAAVQYRIGEYAASVASYHRALALEPDNVSAWLYLGEACSRTGDAVCAQRSLEKAREIDPDDPSIAYQLAEAHVQMKEYDEAAALMREAYVRNPDEVDYLVYIGDVWRMAPDAAKSSAAYREALVLRPTDTELMYKLADALAEDGKPVLAMDVLNQALALNPSFGDAGIFLGNLAFDSKWLERSESAYLMAGKAGHPEAVQGLRNVAYEYSQQKLPERALQVLQSAQTFAPEDASLKQEIQQFQEEIENK